MRPTTFIRIASLTVWSCSALFACGEDTLDTEDDSRAKRVAELSETEGRVARGGRLFDKFYVANSKLDFTPDDESTIGFADGSGEPNGDGTLNDKNGDVLFNDTGHDYRMKSFFGWDLRGIKGIDGERFHGNGDAVQFNLLDSALSRDDIAKIIVSGGDNLPAWGDVLSDDDLAHVVEFISAMNEHRIVQPTDIWALNDDATKNYVLLAGGDAASGETIIAEEQSCGSVDCHGSKGTAVLIEDKYSLGSFIRTHAYEGWFKVLVGHPGSPMGPQIDTASSVSEQSTRMLNIFAALCNRGNFPAHPQTEADVENGDLRCGDYLK